MKSKSMEERISVIASKFAMVANERHFKALQDTFAVLIPIFIVSGLGVLLSNVIFPWFATGTTLTNLQVIGNSIVNGTLNIAGLLVAPVIGYTLSTNSGFRNPIGAMAVSLVCLIVLMPQTVTVAIPDSTKTIQAGGLLSFGSLGTQGMFGGIIVGLAATSLFIAISGLKKLEINLGEQVPPMVNKSFNTMIPAVLTIVIFSFVTYVLYAFFQSDMITLIGKLIQEPLKHINTSLPGYIFLIALGNLFFGFGIHKAIITGTLLDPIMAITGNENTIAFQAGKHIPNIIGGSFTGIWAEMGGAGSTLGLLIAIFIFAKVRSNKDVARLALAPGLFNINEPVIFGLPIVFNFALIIPYVLVPVINILIAYYATFFGLVSRIVISVPWTTPVILSGYVGTAGDIRTSILQALLLVLDVAIWAFFLKISEQVTKKQMAAEATELN